VLWRKLPGSRSAGRVQSVALRLICERETEIENFKSDEYWSVKAQLKNGGSPFWANLTHLDGKKLDRLAIHTGDEAETAKRAIEAASLAVSSIERKRVRRHPSPPFRTSTLQQEAARKLGFAAKRTMQVAQKLYEDGLISYMRTDGVTMAAEAVTAARSHISSSFGKSYLPDAPRVYESKAKNAQEAHEAIRPTDISLKPESVQGESDHRRLYELIWKRTLASQMESAVFDQVAVDIRPVGASQSDDRLTLRATGSIIAFDGFLKLYIEGSDDESDDDESRVLPDMTEGGALARLGVQTEQHFTQPPPRYSEASLVKKLEELGIGRPSTYASILSVLQDRNYVRLDKRRFIPEDRGRLVTAFLQGFFQKYVEYDFTADLEEKLDDVSGGRIDWKQLLRDFWEHFSQQVNATKELRVRDVLDNLNEVLGPHFFRDDGTGGDPRKCRVCSGGMLSLKLGRYGAFIGCSNYPDCKFTRPLAVANGEEGAQPTDNGPKALGVDPATGLEVTLRRGPYGPYVQLGEAQGKEKPKRASLVRGMDAAGVDLQTALGLLSLPRDLGPFPETGEMIQAGIGRFGPYIKCEGTYVSLKDDDVLAIGLNRAISLLADAPRKPKAKEVGKHPDDGKPITLRQGRYGYYVQHGSTRATLPKGTDKDELTLDGAVELIRAKEAASGKTPKKAKASKKKPAKASDDAATTEGEAPAPAKKKSAPRKKKAAPAPVE
jgi:DNA topoisomerase-1